MTLQNIYATHQIWQWYVTEGGGDIRHAASWELCCALSSLLEKLRPDVVIDTGSGLTSIIVQLYARDSGAECWHMDDDAEWAENTRRALAKFKLDGERVVEWKPLDRPIDLIIHDLGVPATRAATMSNVCHWGRVVVADDMHFDEIRHAALTTGRRFQELANTRDGYGRYAAISLPMVALR